MGRGRKTETHTVSEVLPYWSGSGNIKPIGRNLKKGDLGGVIFGCKYSTINECYQKQLFGLPAPHISYVKNIDPGLTLFLFNYSDRKLHGIFEAASHGQLNIDPCAWTSDRMDTTPFAAQVKVQVRLHCEPLLEEKFSRIIAENYFAEKLFWFELDRFQTNKLVHSFSRLSLERPLSPSKKTTPASSSAEQCVPGIKCVDKWSSLFKSSTDLKQNREQFASEVVRESEEAVDGAASSSFNPVGTQKSKGCEIAANEEGRQKTHSFVSPFGPSHSSVVESMMNPSKTNKISSQATKKVKNSESSAGKDAFNKCEDEPHSQDWNAEQSSCMPLTWDYGNQPCGCGDSHLKNSTCGPSHVSDITGDVVAVKGEAKEKHFMDLCQQGVLMSESGSSSLQALVAELLMEVKDLKLSQIQQADRMKSLEKELLESRKEFRQLQGQSARSEAEELPSLTESCPDYAEAILVVGGSDGKSWLSTLDCYSLSKDKMQLFCPMTSSRSCSAVAMLNGEVYMIGGIHEDFCEGGTVESYNREKKVWVGRPSLNRRRDSLAAVSLNGKIFALGGKDGSHTLGNVEMLDLQIAKWITTQPMIQKRFALGAAEINQVLYVVGGHDGTDFLKSVETYDPRVGSWTRLESMSSKRGCHSLVVLHEKLYVIGGQNEGRRVPTVEVFDPRAGHWIPEDPMNQARASFGSVVIRDAIYVLGGIDDKGKVLDTVECYREGYGWQLMDKTGFGRRSFFSSLLF